MGMLGLARGVEIQINKKPVLVCNVELCSLTFRPQKFFSKSNIISTALFGDGASSFVLKMNSWNLQVLNSSEYLWNRTTHFMGWKVEDDGLAVVFDKIIPEFIYQAVNLPVVLVMHALNPNLDVF